MVPLPMAPICREDELDDSDEPLTNVLTNSDFRRICNGKEKVSGESTRFRICYVLELFVQKATNIDNSNGAFLPTKRMMRGLYRVILSNPTGSECRTRVTVGDFEPVWDQVFCMLLDESTISGFVNLELIDENHGEDARTSQGRVVVGRARIRLPEDFGRLEKRKVELVKDQAGLGNTVVGYIHLNLQLYRTHARNFARFR